MWLLKLGSRFGSTFLISGHGFYLSTISILLMYLTLLSGSSCMKMLITHSVVLVEAYVYGIAFSIVPAEIYAA